MLDVLNAFVLPELHHARRCSRGCAAGEAWAAVSCLTDKSRYFT